MRSIRRVCHAQFLLCVVFFSPLTVQASEPVLEALWAEAEAQELWQDPEWWTMLHVHRTLWGQVASRIDDPRFFLAERGKTQPKAELRATLEAFLHPPPLEEGARSIACRFPARRLWLLDRLEIPEELFPGGTCPEIAQTLDSLNLSSATMVYPAAYLNSPASMFGHLLLVLDREGKDRLLSRAVNYAALVQDRFGPLFAFKGIFGLYDGVFAVLPYYDKVEEYTAVNRRDIWEYPLQLDEDQLNRLILHVWELQEISSRYFFFKENCAFNMMYPIEVADPSISITRRFRMSAVPVTLLRELSRTGITADPVFRPSAASRMDHFASMLDPSAFDRVRSLVEGSDPVESDTSVQLDLATEWVKFLYTEQDITPEMYRKRIFPLLRERSKRGTVDLPPPPAPKPPHAGHGPRRWLPYGGVETESGDAVFGLQFRFAYHDWLDDPAGYPEGSTITMFEFDVQTTPEQEETVFESFTLVDIRSLTPPRPWAKPLSWAAHLGMHASPIDRNHHRVEGRFSSGFTRQVAASTLYLMWANVFRWDTALDDNLAWEPGIEWGWVMNGDRVRSGIRGREVWGVLGVEGHRREAEAEVRVGWSRDLFLGLSVSHQRELRQNRNLVTLKLGRTF